MESLKDDYLEKKLARLESEVADIHERYLTVAESIRETHRYLIKLAQNQAQIADQMARWPYIVVDKSSLNQTDTKKKKEQ